MSAVRLRTAAVAGFANSIGSILAVGVFGRTIITQVGLERFGAWGVITFLATLPSLLDLGFSRQTIRELATATDDVTRRRLFSNSFLYAALTSLMSVALSLAFLHTEGFKRSAPSDVRVSTIFVSTASSAILSGAIGFIRSSAEARGNIEFVSYSSLAQTVGAYALGATSCRIFAAYDTALYYSYPAALFAVLIGGLPMTIRLVRTFGAPNAVRLRYFFATFKHGLGYGAAGILSSVTLPANKSFLVYQNAGLSDYAIFDVLTRISESASTVLVSALTPLYRLFLEPLPSATVARLLRRSEIGVLAAFVAGSAAYASVASPLLAYLLNSSVGRIVPLAIATLVLRCSHGMAEPVTRLLWARGIKRVAVYGRVVAILCNALLLVFFHSRHASPLVSAALGYAIPYAPAALTILVLGRLWMARAT